MVAERGAGDDHRAAEGVAYYHRRPVAGGPQEVDAGHQVEGAFLDVVGLAVIHPQRRDALAGEFLRQLGVQAGRRPAEPAARSANPDHRTGGFGRGVPNGRYVAPAGAQYQALAGVALVGRPDQHLFNPHFHG